MSKQGLLLLALVVIIAMLTSCRKLHQYQANIKRRKRIEVLISEHPSMWAEEVKNSFVHTIRKRFGRRIRMVVQRIPDFCSDRLLFRKIFSFNPDYIVAIDDDPALRICAMAFDVPRLLLKTKAEELINSKNIYVVLGSLPAAKYSEIRKNLHHYDFDNNSSEICLPAKVVGKEGAVVMNKLFEGRRVDPIVLPCGTLHDYE